MSRRDSMELNRIPGTKDDATLNGTLKMLLCHTAVSSSSAELPIEYNQGITM